MEDRFKVGDLVVWKESAWEKHLECKNDPRRWLEYPMPEDGFYKITGIYDDGLIYHVQSLKDLRYKLSYDALNFAYKFDLALEKHQEDADLIFALDDIGAL